MNHTDAIAQLSIRQKQLERAKEIEKQAQDAYEQAKREAEQSLPRITPELIAAFQKFEHAESTYGELDSEHCPTAWAALVQLGVIINPTEWTKWLPDEEE